MSDPRELLSEDRWEDLLVTAAIVAAILAGLVLAPIVTGGVLLLVLTLAALAADNDYEKEI